MEERLIRLEENVARLAALLLDFVPEVRNMFGQAAGHIKELAIKASETEDKLNALIDIVDRHERRLERLEDK